MTDLVLRPYQAEALRRTADAEAQGVRRQLGVAATGLGKTVIFSALARERGGRALVLAHRDELVNQAARKIREIWPEANVGIVKGTRDDVRADVVVASVQTLSRAGRMAKLLAPITGDGMLGPLPGFDLVIVDEAHHAAADSYRSILDALDAGGPPVECTRCEPYGPCEICGDTGTVTPPLLLGVTATPDRGDGKGLDDLFDQITWSYDLLWGIRAGFLSDLRGLAVRIDGLDLDNVKMTRGDYQAGDAGRALEDADAPQLIVAAWLEHAMGRRTLVFTPTVATAQAVAAEFTASGVSAGFVSGAMPMEERHRVLEDYTAGRIQVLANCAVLTEGYDEPRTDCVIVARPTKSRALYAQMVGRGTRRHPDKVDCLVLDIVGASDDLSLVTIPTLFGVDSPAHRERLADGSGSATTVLDDFDRELVRQGKLTAEEADLFRQMRGTGISWIPIHLVGERRRFHRPLGDDLGTVVLAESPVRTDDGEPQWVAGVIHHNGQKETLLLDTSMELCQGVAEDYVRAHGRSVLTAADAAWRNKRPSPKQLALARRWGVTVEKGWTSGQVSDALDVHAARKRERQSQRKARNA